MASLFEDLIANRKDSICDKFNFLNVFLTNSFQDKSLDFSYKFLAKFSRSRKATLHTVPLYTQSTPRNAGNSLDLLDKFLEGRKATLHTVPLYTHNLPSKTLGTGSE